MDSDTPAPRLPGARPTAPPAPARSGAAANAVIAALAVSTCVAALACFTVVSRALPHVAALADRDSAPSLAGITLRPVPRPAALVAGGAAPTDPSVVPPRLPDAPAVSVAFADPGIDRAIAPPAQRPQAVAPDARPLADRSPSGQGGAQGTAVAPRQAGGDAPAVASPAAAPPVVALPVRVIAGRPAVVPPPRPAAIAGTAQRAAMPASPTRPTARPTDRTDTRAAPAANAALTAPAAGQADPRPTVRPAPRPPVTLTPRTPAPAVPGPLLAAATMPEAAAPAGAGSCGPALSRDIPRRPGRSAGGAAVMAAVGNGSGADRDRALVAEALRGNIPAHLRDLRPVEVTGTVAGRQTRITVCVMPDYLAIGSDADHVRVPLGLPAALRVADGFGMMLPTPRMVDAIFAQATVRVAPAPMPPTSAMSSTEYFLRHNATVNAQFARAGARDGLLVAGHKKDVVIANRLANAPGRVAIYGWHRGVGDPIQPLSTVHGEGYADYSHGIRLVARTAFVNGRAVDLRALLADGRYAGLLTGDGPLTAPALRTASLR